MLSKQEKLSRKIEKQKLKQEKKDNKYFEKFGLHLSEVEPKNKKENNTLKHFKYFLAYLKYFKLRTFGMILFLILTVTVNILSPYVFVYLIDNLTTGYFKSAFLFGMLYLLIFLLSDLFRYCFYIIASRLSNDVAYKIRVNLFENILKTKTEVYDEVNSGQIISRLTRDVENFCDTIPRVCENISQMLRRIGRLIMIMVLSWYVGLYLLGAGIVTFLIFNYFIKKYGVKNEIRDGKLEDKFTGQSTELVRSNRDLKCLNIENNFLYKIKKLANFKRNSNTQTAKIRNISDLATCIWWAIADVGLYVLMFTLLIQGSITVGLVVMLFTYDYELFSLFINWGLVKRQLVSAEVNAKRMYEVLDKDIYKKEVFGNSALRDVKGKIEFKNVNFKYKNSLVLENLSFLVSPQQCVGIVGESGQGKSTIINLIPKLYEIEKGSIEIDGVDISTLTKESLRETVSVVSQNPYVFNMSIKENLLLAKPNATMEEIDEACKKAEIYDFIMSKPNGYETIIGEGGIILSGGQRQRLALARAFLKGSKILLLDEATSALDNISQEKIKEVIDSLKHKCTIIIVAHRLSTVVDCDKILVVGNKKIIAEGSHSELLENCDEYKKLYLKNDE